MIQLPERFLHKRTAEGQDEAAAVNTQTLLDDMNFVKNQLQCEIVKLKSSTLQHSSDPRFFRQRNPESVN